MFWWFQYLQIVWKILTRQSRANGRENCVKSCQQVLKVEAAQKTIFEREIRVQFSARDEGLRLLVQESLCRNSPPQVILKVNLMGLQSPPIYQPDKPWVTQQNFKN